MRMASKRGLKDWVSPAFEKREGKARQESSVPPRGSEPEIRQTVPPKVQRTNCATIPSDMSASSLASNQGTGRKCFLTRHLLEPGLLYLGTAFWTFPPVTAFGRRSQSIHVDPGEMFGPVRISSGLLPGCRQNLALRMPWDASRTPSSSVWPSRTMTSASFLRTFSSSSRTSPSCGVGENSHVTKREIL
jgi:hypothetical protein